MRFEVLDISGDAGIKAYGSGMAEAFANAGIGMYSLITDLGGVAEFQSAAFEVSAESPEEVLVGYLNELVFRFDTYGFIGKRVEVTDISERHVRVTVHGEKFDPEKHEQRLLIKAATYHNIKIAQVNGGWEVEVVFDI